jgi:uncharacterized membrane protein
MAHAGMRKTVGDREEAGRRDAMDDAHQQTCDTKDSASPAQALADAHRKAREEYRDHRSRITERLCAFFDAVLAIAITLLTLELAFPEAEQFGAVELQELYIPFTALLISYVALGQAWYMHTKTFSQMHYRATDAEITGHLFLMFFVMLFPKTTELIANYPSSRLAIAIYLACFLAMVLTLFALMGSARNKQLKKIERAYGEQYLPHGSRAKLTELAHATIESDMNLHGLVKSFLGILTREFIASLVDLIGITGAVICLFVNPLLSYVFFLADIVITAICYHGLRTLYRRASEYGRACHVSLEDVDGEEDEDAMGQVA